MSNKIDKNDCMHELSKVYDALTNLNRSSDNEFFKKRVKPILNQVKMLKRDLEILEEQHERQQETIKRNLQERKNNKKFHEPPKGRNAIRVSTSHNLQGAFLPGAAFHVKKFND